MDFGVIFFVITACLVCAAAVYVTTEYRRHGEQQDEMKKFLGAQADTAAVKKELAGYAKYADYLAGARAMLVDKVKAAPTKVLREYVYIENIAKEGTRQKLVVTLVVRYTAEFVCGAEAKSESFEVTATPGGVQLWMSKPTLVGNPMVKIQSSEFSMLEELPNEKLILPEAHKKIPGLARAHGEAVVKEEAIVALCERKLVEALREYLLKQSGVTQVPAIVVTYK
jgi:hypothetical protein